MMADARSPTAAPQQAGETTPTTPEFISPRVLRKKNAAISKDLVSARRHRIEEKLLETRPSTSRRSMLSLNSTGSSSPTAESLSPGAAALARARENIEGRRKSRELAKARVSYALASLEGRHTIPPPTPEGRSELDETETANEFIDQGREEAELNGTATKEVNEQKRIETEATCGEFNFRTDDEYDNHFDEQDLDSESNEKSVGTLSDIFDHPEEAPVWTAEAKEAEDGHRLDENHDLHSKSNEKSVGTLSSMFDHPEEAPVWTPEAKEAYSAVFEAKSELSVANTSSTSFHDDDSAQKASFEEANAARLAQLQILGESQVWGSIQSAGWRKRQRMIYLSE